MKTKRTAVAVAALVLAACGGDGSSTDPAIWYEGRFRLASVGGFPLPFADGAQRVVVAAEVSITAAGACTYTIDRHDRGAMRREYAAGSVRTEADGVVRVVDCPWSGVASPVADGLSVRTASGVEYGFHRAP